LTSLVQIDGVQFNLAGNPADVAYLNMLKCNAGWQKVNKILFKLLGEYCGKSADQVMQDATRDFWLDAEAAKKYGIIDSIVGAKSKPTKSKK
jgi:ATP-dependent protease ClpP protease subunit